MWQYSHLRLRASLPVSQGTVRSLRIPKWTRRRSLLGPRIARRGWLQSAFGPVVMGSPGRNVAVPKPNLPSRSRLRKGLRQQNAARAAEYVLLSGLLRMRWGTHSLVGDESREPRGNPPSCVGWSQSSLRNVPTGACPRFEEDCMRTPRCLRCAGTCIRPVGL